MLPGRCLRRPGVRAGGGEHDQGDGPQAGAVALVRGGAFDVLGGGDDGGVVEDGARRRWEVAADGVQASLAAGGGEVVEVASGRPAGPPPGRPSYAGRARDAREGLDVLRAVEAGPSAAEVGEAAHARELSHADGRYAEAGGDLAGGHERRFVVDGVLPLAAGAFPPAGEGERRDGGYAEGRVSSAVILSLGPGRCPSPLAPLPPCGRSERNGTERVVGPLRAEPDAALTPIHRTLAGHDRSRARRGGAGGEAAMPPVNRG